MLVLGIIVFLATNIDDLFVLVAFFADPKTKPWPVVFGQLLGMIAILAVSVLGALAIPDSFVRALGLLPLGIGLWKLLQKREERPRNVAAQTLAVAGVTIANGGDNLAVYAPLFANSSRADLVLLTSVFLALTCVLCAAAFALVRAPWWSAHVRRFGGAALPWVLIALGVFLLIRPIR